MKTVVVVGIGALGSHVVQFLRNLEAKVCVVDYDRVEQKNVASQFHAGSSVGKAKAVALRQTMQFLFGMKVESIPHKVVVDNATEILGRADLVLDCLDNAESRRVVQETVRSAGIPCLHGALAADGGFGRVVWDEEFQIDEESASRAATCENGEHLPFIAITAAYLASATQEFVLRGRKTGYHVHPGGVVET